MNNPRESAGAPPADPAPKVVQDVAVQRSLKVLQNLLRLAGREPASGSKSASADAGELRNSNQGDFAVRFWDGTVWEPEGRNHAEFTLVLQHPGALRRMFWPPNDLTLGEAYIYDDFDVEGDIHAFFALMKGLKARKRGLRERLSLVWQLLGLPAAKKPRLGHQPAQLSGQKHSLRRERQAISYHYDVSNQFFALWLDSRMTYSCAYFQSFKDDLEAAQERKLDYLCRKLRLKRGERLLDIGCGWGGLVIHAVKNYGVRAIGITLSRRQAELANERIRQAGLGAESRVEYLDYREVGLPEGFDKLVSVGMFEHVGRKLLDEYFRQAWRLLRPGGVFLNHGIALGGSALPHRTTFARRYVFPDGELVPLRTTLATAEGAGFEIRDVESLREHYALTLACWLNRLEAHHEEARQATDEATYRTWRIYMAGAAEGFRTGIYNIYQTLLVKPDQGHSGLPLTRADWYG